MQYVGETANGRGDVAWLTGCTATVGFSVALLISCDFEEGRASPYPISYK